MGAQAALAMGAQAGLAVGERVHLALPQADGPPLLLWAKVVRGAPEAALAFEPPPAGPAAALDALLAAQGEARAGSAA